MPCRNGAAGAGGDTEAAPPAHDLIDGNNRIALLGDNGLKGAEAFADEASGTDPRIDVTDHGFQDQFFSGR